LRGQLIALVLGALVAAQLISLALFLDERGRALLYATAEDTAGRALTLADALDSAERRDRRRLLREAGGRNLRFTIDAVPRVSEDAAEDLDWLARRMTATGTARALRLTEADQAPPAPDRRRGPEPDDIGLLLLSTALADGSWLNAQALMRSPPAQLAAPALASVALTALALTAVIWIAVRRISGPMAALTEATARLGRGERPDPLPLAGPAEMRSVTRAFNDMADRLSRLIEQQARTLGAIGHDLRSPITAMRLRLELVDDDETRERLGVCLDEIQSLVEAALALARGDGAGEPLADTDLRALLAGLTAEMQEAGQAVTLADGPPLAVRARPQALKRALRNLAENAVRYGGAARLELHQTGGAAVVTIDDDGPGIAEADRARVFEPFVRLEGSRSRDTGGAGLGLAIARAAIEGQGGTVALTDAPGGGTRAVVSLPMA
jgi:signal transduction histidine kinase